jgi:hypothetical protein
MKRLRYGFVVAIFVLGSCSTPEMVVTDIIQDAADGLPMDLGSSDAIEVAGDGGEDGWLPDGDMFEDSRSWDLAQEVDGGAACAPGEGCFLDSCKENSDCMSGWCVEHMGEGVCTITCQEECPPGWLCKLLGSGGTDPVYVCISEHSNLCKPCAANGGCQSPGGAENACISYAEEGDFCGGECGLDDVCPWGFSCQDVETVEGVFLRQCVADAGVCPCTGKSVSLGLSTPCLVENEWGTCTGKRVCTDEGLSACDAGEPQAEFCNGTDDNCDGDVDEPQFVEGAYIPLCDDGNPCTTDSCLGEAGCQSVDLDGGECFDGNPCTIADHCSAGVCDGSPVDCDDDNPCTDDSCDESGGCVFVDNLVDCDDGNPCTVADECQEGLCSGVAVSCDCQQDEDCAELDDGNVCNGELFCDTAQFPYKCAILPDSEVACPNPEGLDSACQQAVCNPDDGICSFQPFKEGVACDDGDACSIGEICTAGSCLSQMPLACDDGNVCTQDLCNPDSGCEFTAVSGVCDDGNPCTLDDACSGGKCIGGSVKDCDDANPCTADTCSMVLEGCNHTPVEGACDDEDPCTLNDYCLDGQCVSGVGQSCNDGNPCTADSCGPDGACQHEPMNLPCDDGNACTEGDSCSDGVCVYSGLLDCDDMNLCTTDSCDPVDGCVHALNSTPCDDSDVCTTGDHCHLGECISTGNLTCNDGNLCTADSCQPQAGCAFVPNQAVCDDSDACTENDVCADGICESGSPKNCDDGDPCTDDLCAPAMGCEYSHNNALCDDLDACTAGEFCAGGQCGGGTAVTCDDSIDCTDDSCHPVTGCVFANNQIGCSDNNLCTVDDGCVDGVCQPGDALVCNDGEVCTTDSCLSDSGCLFENVQDGTECGQDLSCQNGKCVDACETGTVTFNYTGGAQTWIVPGCVHSVAVDVHGAQGGSNANSPPDAGPLGGRAKGTLSVTPGQTLHIYVGGGGDSGGWNGGGGINGGYPKSRGGGASDLRTGAATLSDRVIVAGGAGGHPPYSLGHGGWHGAAGGVGGGLNGGTGQNSDGNQPDACGGGGGTQNNGGAAGCSQGSGLLASAGTFGQGGDGGGENDNDSCGAGSGGGGGWYGGGGGGHQNCGGGGGGGGSSYLGGVSDGTTEAGVRAGHGQIIIEY